MWRNKFMTQENKELLLKDLCGRLPYNVAINCKNDDSNYICYLTTDIINELKYNREYYEYKPYLFPLSSMTDEQREEYNDIKDNDGYSFDANGNIFTLQDFYSKYHLDYRCLIEKSIALDATNLNIY